MQERVDPLYAPEIPDNPNEINLLIGSEGIHTTRTSKTLD
jgi:hypothetical protein